MAPGQQSDIELQRTYVLLTRLRDEYEPLRAQLLARHPFVSLIDALAAVRNEEIRLRSAGLLPSMSALAARSAPSRPAVPSLSSPSPAPVPSPSGRGGGGGLHCDYCGKDGHVEAFYYREKKAQFRSQTRPASQNPPVSQPSGSASAGASQRSSIDPVTQEMLMLLRRLAASSSSGTASVATRTGSPEFRRRFSSSTRGPPGSSHGSPGCTGPRRRDSQRLWELDWLRLPSAVNICLLLFVRFFLRKVLLLSFLALALMLRTVLLNASIVISLRRLVLLCLLLPFPLIFGPRLFSTATYLINIQPSSALHGDISLERLCGKTPDYSDLRLFGCVCYVLLAPRERTKLTAQSIECVFLGYSAEYKGYRCWDPVGRRMRISRDVVFDESHPFYPYPSSDASLASLVDPLSFLIIPDTAIAHISSRLVPSPTVPSSGVVPPSVVPPVESSSESSSLIPNYTAKPPVTHVYTRRSASTPPEPSSSASESSFGEPSPTASPSSFLAVVIDLVSLLIGMVLDVLLGKALLLAMAEEIAALERTGTWDLIPTPSHVCPITCKWVYKVKTRSDGSLERYKARLVACGFQQEHGRDYDETFAPVAHMTTVHALLAVASVREWSISQLDVKNAFLNGELREEVYMQPPPGYSVPEGMGLLDRASITDHKTEETPMELNLHLSATDGEPLNDPTRYRHIVVFLFLLPLNSTIVTFFVSYVIFVGLCPIVCSFHALALYSFRLTVTWASDSSDRRSLSTYCVFLGCSLIAWKTKKQTAVSRSSTEVELRAMALVTAEVTWLRSLLADFGVSVSIPTPLLTDSTGAISIARDPVKHELTKHIGVDAYYTRAQVQDGVVTLRYVPSELQLADFLTKVQNKDQHRFYLSKVWCV
ncbi:LOW QUALITY PROTEIN: hypothetical protein U9M48_019768 [Paspalum notatum var. saurae]|uniref:Reverse transcriptase Ty1/copia-type domain-containing protein n=1 Tax=Paspalum notatum var. saurae TaxID=547442 RepID=A0AAQ3TD15_PASNO